MTFTVLLWNFNMAKGDDAKRLATYAEYSTVVADVAQDQSADLVVILECRISENSLLEALKARDEFFEVAFAPHERFKFFTRFPHGRLGLTKSTARVVVARLDYDSSRFKDVLLAPTHCVDAFNNSRDKQWKEVRDIREVVEAAEAMVGHKRTILFGDFNMNPYHIGMTDPDDGFGAMMSWELAEAHARDDGKDRWYNPMWGVMGGSASPGTYYWPKNEPENSYWNCIDGVLVRTQLRAQFSDSPSNPTIVNSYRKPDGEVVPLFRLADKHHRIAFSDHLPLVFRFELPGLPATKTEVTHD